MQDDIRQLAIIGVQSEIARLNALLLQLKSRAAGLRRPVGRPKGTGSRGILDAPAKRKRRKMSAAGRKRISEMMKARWAARRKAKGAK